MAKASWSIYLHPILILNITKQPNANQVKIPILQLQLRLEKLFESFSFHLNGFCLKLDLKSEMKIKLVFTCTTLLSLSNFPNEITWTKAGPAAPKKAMFLLAWPDSSAPPKKVRFRLVLGSSASRISLRWPEIVLFSSGPDSWNCLRPATRVTLVLLLASFLSRASRSNFFLVNLTNGDTDILWSHSEKV